MSTEHPAPPALRIVHGAPAPEELAALVVVLAAASGGGPGAAAPAAEASRWAPPERLLRVPVAPSGWWASALPR